MFVLHRRARGEYVFDALSAMVNNNNITNTNEYSSSWCNETDRYKYKVHTTVAPDACMQRIFSAQKEI